MKKKTMLLAFAFCVAMASAAFAADANLGSWKLNEAKSKIPKGGPKNTTVVYTAEGDSFKCVVDGVDGTGKPMHNEWTGKFDGKEYAVTGDPTSDMRSIKKVDESHYTLTASKDGKPVVEGTIVFSKDGKTRTVKTHGTRNSTEGKAMTSSSVYDKL